MSALAERRRPENPVDRARLEAGFAEVAETHIVVCGPGKRGIDSSFGTFDLTAERGAAEPWFDSECEQSVSLASALLRSSSPWKATRGFKVYSTTRSSLAVVEAVEEHGEESNGLARACLRSDRGVSTFRSRTEVAMANAGPIGSRYPSRLVTPVVVWCWTAEAAGLLAVPFTRWARTRSHPPPPRVAVVGRDEAGRPMSPVRHPGRQPALVAFSSEGDSR
jgi:hypothetical protein